MISLRLWNKLCVLRKNSICAVNVCKAKLGQLVFDNLKPVRLHVFYTREQNLTQSRTLDEGTSNSFKKKPRYYVIFSEIRSFVKKM
jgi:hypothetical protein